MEFRVRGRKRPAGDRRNTACTACTDPVANTASGRSDANTDARAADANTDATNAAHTNARADAGPNARALAPISASAVQSAGADRSAPGCGLCGDAWFRQGLATGEREPRCRLAS